MKELVKVRVMEVEGEGLEAFYGKRITVFCDTYIYSGELVGVNTNFIKLENPELVYETGAFDTKKWQNAQRLPSPWYVQTSKIESFGELK